MTTTLYNKTTPNNLILLMDIIVDVYNFVPKLIWSNKSHEEIGFYSRDKKTKNEVFFGIWYEAWAQFGSPLCIAIWDNSYAPIEKNLAIKKLVDEKKIEGVTFTIDFQGYATLIFNQEYFNWEDDAKRIAQLFKDISSKLGIILTT